MENLIFSLISILMFLWLVKLFNFSSIVFFLEEKYINIYFILSIISLIYFSFLLWSWNYLDSSFSNNFRILLISFSVLGYFTLSFVLKDYRLDVIFLYFCVLMGSILVIWSYNLFVIYLGLELQTFSIFLLISKNKWFLKGSEASLKYFILSALSSGFYLLGLNLLYNIGFSLNVDEVFYVNFLDLKTLFSLIIIFFSMFFKLGLFPFQFWLADIYEGSDWEIIGLISILPKISTLSVIFKLLSFVNLILLIGLFSIIIGTFSAINQTKIKRLLAYSSIGHMGFILVIMGLNLQNSFEVVYVYWLIYMFGFLGIIILSSFTFFSEDYKILDLIGLYNTNKIKAITWSLLLISISGIPPLSGFISKWFVLTNFISMENNFLALICLIFSIISAGYYLRIVQMIFFHPKPSYLVFKNLLLLESNNNFYNISLSFLGFFLFFSLSLIFNPNPWFLLFFNCVNFYN